MANQNARLKLQLMVTEVVQLQRLWLGLIGLISSAKPFEAMPKVNVCMQCKNTKKRVLLLLSTVVARGLCNYNLFIVRGTQMALALKKIGTLAVCAFFLNGHFVCAQRSAGNFWEFSSIDELNALSALGLGCLVACVQNSKKKRHRIRR